MRILKELPHRLDKLRRAAVIAGQSYVGKLRIGAAAALMRALSTRSLVNRPFLTCIVIQIQFHHALPPFTYVRKHFALFRLGNDEKELA